MAQSLDRKHEGEIETMEQDPYKSFSKGEENDEKNMVAENTTTWREQLADKQPQICEEIFDQEEERLGSLGRPKTTPSIYTTVADLTYSLTAEVAAQAQKIAVQAQEIDRLGWEETCAGELRRQLSEKDEEIKRVQAEIVSRTESLRQQLATKDQEITHLQNEVTDELFNHQEAMRASVEEQRRREQALTRSYNEKIQQLRIRHLGEQQNPSGASMDIDGDISGLTDRVSTLHFQPELDDRAPEPTNSNDGQIRQMLADQLSSTEKPPQDLARQKTSNESLQQSLAEPQVQKENQPPAEDCAARLQKLQARLEKMHACELEEQAARIFEDYKQYAHVYQAHRDAKLAQTTAEALEEKQRLQQAIAGLEKEMEACHGELEGHEKFSRNAVWTIQSLKDREKELDKDKRRLFNAKKELEASLSQKAKDCRGWSTQARVLKASLKRTERTMEAAMGEVMDVTQAKKTADAEARSLRIANRALGVEKKELEEKSSSAIGELSAGYAELDHCQIQSEQLTAELGRLGSRLAEREATIEKEADHVHGLDKFLNGRQEAWEQWEEAAPPPVLVIKEAEKGGRDMNVLLEVPEKAKEGHLRARSHHWKGFMFLSFLWLMGLLVVVFSAASAANRERQTWLRVDEVTRHVVISLRAGMGPELLWQDPLLDLSRGMFGV